MITLITGAPGSGKSLILVDEFLQKAKQEGRQIVADGIPELVIEHEPADTVDKWTVEQPDPSSQTGKKLSFTFPQGSLVVVDECQRVFRPRKAGATVPNEVAAFETHRHLGLDFVLLTQHPGLLDSNVRRLVGRHLHIRDLGFLGRWVYEFPEASDPERYKMAMVKRKWTLPKRSFSLYKSSSLHVKPKRGFPTALKVLAVSLVLLAVGVYYIYGSIQSKLHPAEVKQAAAVVPMPGAPGVTITATEYNPMVELLPRHPDYPESAPIYDNLRQVKVMPVVAGCVRSRKACSCYSQQGTVVHVTDQYCQSYVKAPPFNPYIEPVQVVENNKNKPAEAAPTPAIGVLPGIVAPSSPVPSISPQTPNKSA